MGAKFITLLCPISGAFVKGLAEGVRKWGRFLPSIRSDKGTSCRYENAEAARTTRIPPSPQPSPPLSKGGEGTGVGGFCLQKAASARRTRVAGVYPYQKPRRKSHFSNTLCQPLRVFEKCGFCPHPAGSPHCVRGTAPIAAQRAEPDERLRPRNGRHHRQHARACQCFEPILCSTLHRCSSFS